MSSTHINKPKAVLEELFDPTNWEVALEAPPEDAAHRCAKAKVTSINECDPAKSNWKFVGFFDVDGDTDRRSRMDVKCDGDFPKVGSIFYLQNKVQDRVVAEVFEQMAQRREWGAAFSSSTTLTTFMRQHGADHNVDKEVLKFYQTLSSIMFSSSNSVDNFESRNAGIVRWVKRCEDVLPGLRASFPTVESTADTADSAASSSSCHAPNPVASLFPQKWRYVLQLKESLNDGAKWQDWVEIRQSNIRPAGLGLFACRRFSKDSFLGVHLGNVVHRDDEPHLEQHSSLDELDGEANSCVRDFEGRLMAVNAPRLDLADPTKKVPLCMGFQHVNDASLTYEDNGNPTLVGIGRRVRLFLHGSFFCLSACSYQLLCVCVDLCSRPTLSLWRMELFKLAVELRRGRRCILTTMRRRRRTKTRRQRSKNQGLVRLGPLVKRRRLERNKGH